MKTTNFKKPALTAAIVGFLALALNSTAASAATLPTTFGVYATVQPVCLISTIDLPFEAYTEVAPNLTPTDYENCAADTTYSAGLNPTVDSPSYFPNSNSGMTNNLSEIFGTDVTAGTHNQSIRPINISGQIFATPHFTPGSYADTIVTPVSIKSDANPEMVSSSSSAFTPALSAFVSPSGNPPAGDPGISLVRPVPVAHPTKVLDAKYFLLNGLHLGMGMLDVALTQHCIAAHQCSEGNPMMPSSLGAQLGVNFASVGYTLWASYKLKKRHATLWWLSPTTGIAAHTAGVVTGLMH